MRILRKKHQTSNYGKIEMKDILKNIKFEIKDDHEHNSCEIVGSIKLSSAIRMTSNNIMNQDMDNNAKVVILTNIVDVLYSSIEDDIKSIFPPLYSLKHSYATHEIEKKLNKILSDIKEIQNNKIEEIMNEERQP